MASDTTATTTHTKRKFDDEEEYQHRQKSPPPRRQTGFSDGPSPAPASAASPYGAVPPPVMDEFELAKQRFQSIANRALQNLPPSSNNNNNNDSNSVNGNDNVAKRSKFDNGGGSGIGFSNPSDQKPVASYTQVGGHSHSGSKTIEVPNGRVGVIIGKAGETIKYIQNQSGARIQVTRDMDHDHNSPNRMVELMGNPDQIAKAEQLINDVLSEAETGGPGSATRNMPRAAGSDQFVIMVPSHRVGLVIGKGGETIKSIQNTSGARVQVIPLHPPQGVTLAERKVQIDGSSEQIETAKQMINEIIENRHRNPAAGAYNQPPSSWAPPSQVQQPGGYGYTQPGAYQYNSAQAPYYGYPPQPASTGYAQNWDQSGTPQGQQAPQGSGHDYYAQQQPPSGQTTDNTGYNYSQPATYAGYGQQGYSQDGYGAGSYPPPTQPGYGQPPSNPQQQGYGSNPGYGNVSNPPQDGHPPYNGQGETNQVPPQQGYMGQSGTDQAGYGVPPSSQASGYGTVPPAQGGYASGYGASQGQITPPNQPSYGQPQQSPSQGSGYSQNAAGQPGAYPSPYGAPPVTAPNYSQQPPAYYGGPYSQPPAYPVDGSAPAPAAAPVPTPAAAPVPTPAAPAPQHGAPPASAATS